MTNEKVLPNPWLAIGWIDAKLEQLTGWHVGWGLEHKNHQRNQIQHPKYHLRLKG